MFAWAHFTGLLDAPTVLKRQSVLITVVLLGVTAALLSVFGRRGWRAAIGVAIALSVLSVWDLNNLNIFLPPDEARPEKPRAITELQSQPGPFRIVALRASPSPAAEQHRHSVRPGEHRGL